MFFLKLLDWEHPGAKNHTPQASGRGWILVWVFPNLKTSENLKTGKGLTHSKPVQNLAPPRFGKKSEDWILKVHNSDFESVAVDDTEIFNTLMTWSTF